jgi:uncharacterized protein YkwD
MHVKQLVRRRIAVVAIVAIMGATAASCGFTNTSSSPPPDPYTSGLFNALNYDRARSGLPGLAWSPKLANAAGGWAQQMARANALYHQDLGSLISSPGFVGYRGLGENIFVGSGAMSPGQVEGAWMNSPPHRANILSGGFNIVGIAYVRGGDGRIWLVQDFGTI